MCIASLLNLRGFHAVKKTAPQHQRLPGVDFTGREAIPPSVLGGATLPCMRAVPWVCANTGPRDGFFNSTQLHPLVSPQVSHFAHAPLRTSVSCWQFGH